MATPYSGEVVMLTKRAHERLKRDKVVAETRAYFAEQDAERTRQWVVENHNRERQLSDRCTYLYGLAASLGATPEQLCPPTKEDHDRHQ